MAVKARPPGALCLRCETEPARLHPEHGYATGYCSDRCQKAVYAQRRAARSRAARPEVGERIGLRPAGALCRNGCGRPAVPEPRSPGWVRSFCEHDRCRANYYKRQQYREQAAVANTIRGMLGLDDKRGAQFTLPELVAMERRLRRLVPYGGMAMRTVATRRQERRSA